MLTITKLKMWKDPGYTRECVEVPPAGSRKLPVPDYSSTAAMRPRKSEIMNELQIPVPFLQLKDMSYMYIEVTDGTTPTPNTMQMFGWVLDVSEIASAAEACAIRWTPDWWRTCSGSAVFGKGTVTRCNDASYKRPFITQPRKWIVSSTSPAEYPFSTTTYMFILMVSENFAQNVYVEFPPNSGNQYPVQVSNETKFSYYWEYTDMQISANRRTPSMSELFSGIVDEVIGNNVTPASIIGGWIVPAGSISSSIFSGTTQVTNTYSGDTIVVNKSTGIKGGGVSTLTMSNNILGKKSDDMYKCVAVDPFGNVCGMLPWGFSFTSKTAYTVTNINPDGVTIYLFPDGAFWNRLLDGYYLTFEGIPIPINTNAWSEYAYTGQREYDKRVAEIQRNQQTVSGFAGTGQSMVGGAIAGAVKGNVAGAVGGAIAGGVTSIIGTTIGHFTQGYFNDKFQDETDKLVSNQVSNLKLNGSGIAFKDLAKTWAVYQLEADAVSMAEYTAKVTNDGYTVDIPVGSASAFVTAGGPLQVQNMMISGTIPPQAKTYIKNIMANGIRIVENNPSGTDPGA